MEPTRGHFQKRFDDMDVSENSGFSPANHSLKNWVFHYKPSISGYHYFWKHPHIHKLLFFILCDVELNCTNVDVGLGHPIPAWRVVQGLFTVLSHVVFFAWDVMKFCLKGKQMSPTNLEYS